MDEDEKAKPMGQVIRIDGARIEDHLGEMVRGTVERALNAMLDAEADELCGARRCERSEGRRDTRAGSNERSLDTKAGPVKLKVPTLRRQTFETAIVDAISGAKVRSRRPLSRCPSRTSLCAGSRTSLKRSGAPASARVRSPI